MNAMPCWQRGLRMHIKTIHRAAVYKHEFHIQLDAEQTFYPNQTLGVTWGDWFFPPQRPVFKTMFAASLLATKTTWRVSPLQKNCRATEADFFLSLCVMIFVDPAFVFCFVLLAFCSIHECSCALVVYVGSLQIALFGIDRSSSMHISCRTVEAADYKNAI